jgi:small subunit ribosomal protein S13
MARIVGVDIPNNKRGEVALTYIFGIGRSRAKMILEEAGVDPNAKVQDWNDDQFGAIRRVIGDNYKVEGQLRSEVQMNIK